MYGPGVDHFSTKPLSQHHHPACCLLFHPQVRQQDVLSSWSGIRPLAADPTAAAAAEDGVSSSSSGSSKTAGISRDHVIFSEPNGLVTITGVALKPAWALPTAFGQMQAMRGFMRGAVQSNAWDEWHG